MVVTRLLVYTRQHTMSTVRARDETRPLDLTRKQGFLFAHWGLYRSYLWSPLAAPQPLPPCDETCWRRIALLGHLRRFRVVVRGFRRGCRRGSSAQGLKHIGPLSLVFELLLKIPPLAISFFEPFPQIRHLTFEMRNERVPLVPCRWPVDRLLVACWFRRGGQEDMPGALIEQILSMGGGSNGYSHEYPLRGVVTNCDNSGGDQLAHRARNHRIPDVTMAGLRRANPPAACGIDQATIEAQIAGWQDGANGI